MKFFHESLILAQDERWRRALIHASRTNRDRVLALITKTEGERVSNTWVTYLILDNSRKTTANTA